MSTRPRLTLGALVLTLFGGGPLSAQPVPQPERSLFFVQNAPSSQQFFCGTINVATFGSGTSSTGCTEGGVTYGGTASAVAGAARSEVQISGTAIQGIGGGNNSRSAAANSWWRDRMTFTAGAASTLKVSLSWTGSLAASYSAPTGVTPSISAYAFWNFQAFGAGFGRLIPDYVGVEQANAAFENTSVTRTINDQQTFYIPLLDAQGNPLPWIDLGFSARTSVSINDYLVGSATYSASATADMMQTAKIVGLNFLDAGGNDVTGAMTYSFANGTQVYDAAPVPEPAGWLLAATALIGIFAKITTEKRRV